MRRGCTRSPSSIARARMHRARASDWAARERAKGEAVGALRRSLTDEGAQISVEGRRAQWSLLRDAPRVVRLWATGVGGPRRGAQSGGSAGPPRLTLILTRFSFQPA